MVIANCKLQIGTLLTALLLVGGVWTLATADEKQSATPQQKPLSEASDCSSTRSGRSCAISVRSVTGAADLEEAELDVTGRDALLKGGESGPVTVVPKEAEKSLLYRAVRRDDPDLAMRRMRAKLVER